MHIKYCLVFITIILLATSCRKPTSIFDDLKSDEKLEAAYHFSPSTLRMLNFQNDTAINKLVKNVQKLSLLSMKPSDLNSETIRAYSESFQANGRYELYLEIDGPENQCYILGDETSDKTIALYGQGERAYVMDVTGEINYAQLPEVYRSLSQRDSTTTDGFTLLFDVMNQDAENEKRRRERKRKWEEKRAQEEAEKQKEIVPDSLLLD